MDLSESTTEWAKFGKIKETSLVGKDYIAIGSGCHILFINIISKAQYLYHADGKGSEQGEGVSTITGHKSQTFFAFAEKCSSPKVFIKHCPTFELICILAKKTTEDYTALAFSEGEFIVTLNTSPSFEFIVWNWRNGLRIASMKSNIFGRYQRLKCNLTTPICVAQLQTARNRLNLWEIAICGRKCVLTPHRLTYPSEAGIFSDVLWTTEGTLFVLDVSGCVYALGNEYNLQKVIHLEEEGKTSKTVTSLTWLKGGLLVSGPSGQIKHYKKTGSWECDWTIDPPTPMKRILSNFKDLLVGLNQTGEIVKYETTDNEFKFILQHQSKFDEMCMIYPVGEYFATLQHNHEVTCWEISSGEMKDIKELNGLALTMKENPEYPYVAVGYDNGVLELLSFYQPDKIRTMTYFNLSKVGLESIYFTEIGKLIVAANLSVGEFFVIEGIPGTQMRIIATLETNAQICDYMIVASRTCMRLFTIQITSDLYIAGNKIVRYCIIRDQPGHEVKLYKLERKTQIYSKIYVTSKDNRDRVFLAVPLTTKCIHELTTKRGDPFARVTDVLDTKHLMKKISLHTDNYHSITYAYDGLVMIRSQNFDEIVAVVMPHYRTFGGVQKAYVDPLRKHVITLGRDNTLVCTSLTDTVIDERKQEQLREVLNSARMQLMFKRVTTGFTPKGEFATMTWKEVAHMERKAYEEEIARTERSDIIREFCLIRDDVQRLLTENIEGPSEGPENELLDVQEFNLDVQLKEQRIQQSQIKCQNTKLYLEALIVAQDKVTSWIKGFCWDAMEVQGKCVTGIFSNFQVENYALPPNDDELNALLNYIDGYRKIELDLSKEDSFQPWIAKHQSDLASELAQLPKLSEIDTGPNLQDFLGDEEELPEETIDYDMITAYNGAMTHLFVELNPYHYTQQEISTFQHSELQIAMCLMEILKLKLHLNTRLDEMVLVKEREMGFLYERNARLRHILSELNFFSEVKIEIQIEDPVWAPYERPETILQVQEKEVGITPYISPSEQALLDAAAAEQERIRLLLLADNFRELALIVMMNGVLEIRWEDELKKDVPKPKCMLEKEPEEFNEEEIRTAMAYEEEVRFLHSERERYKKMLEVEYGRLTNTLRDGVKKFNNRLAEFLLTKTRVESAIRHEHLKTCRMRYRNLIKIQSCRKEAELLKAIENNHSEMEALHALLGDLNETLHELRAFNDALTAKEKIVEKAFKKEFMEYSSVIQDQVGRLYKRRPKVTMRSVTSLYLTLEVAKCITSQEKSILLTPDCIDFMKSIDTLDLYVNIPTSVEESTYVLLCKQRRFKIEIELRFKAAAMEIAEGEATIMTFQKLLLQKKELAQKLLQELEQLRQKRLQDAHNLEMQFVLRQGIVEIPTTGKISDFDDAVMLSRKDIEMINKIILKAGQKKIKSLKETMTFRRGILIMEWKHTRLRMQIQDLKSYIEDVKSINLTKDLQSYLKSKARGQSPDKIMSLEQEIEMVKASYERMIADKKYKVEELEKQINYYKKENTKLDEQIAAVNVDVCEYQLDRDFALEKKERDVIKFRMATLLKRARLTKEIQQNHSELLVLQTELELLRLRTFPTLSYTILS